MIVPLTNAIVRRVGPQDRQHRAAIDRALDSGLSNGLTESTIIWLLTRIAFGFNNIEPLIALAMLALGSHPPSLPGRT